MASVRIDEKTPHGGAYGILYYYDDSGNSVALEDATRAVGCEFSEDGRLIYESFFTINRKDKDKAP